MIQFGRVLIIDDSAMMRAVVRKSLAMSKVLASEIVEATNGNEAIALLSDKPFDIMFCDLNMPELNGDEMIAYLETQGSIAIPPIVIVSSEATNERVDRLNSPHIIGVLRKPFTPEKIIKLFSEAKESIRKELV